MPQIDPTLDPALELARVRAEITRLQQREAELALRVHPGSEQPAFRRGWPVQRAVSAGGSRSPA